MQQQQPIAGPSRYFTPSYPHYATDSGPAATVVVPPPTAGTGASSSPIRLPDGSEYAFDYTAAAGPVDVDENGHPGVAAPGSQQHHGGGGDGVATIEALERGHATLPSRAFQVGGSLTQLGYEEGGGAGAGFGPVQRQEPFATSPATGGYDFGPADPDSAATDVWLASTTTGLDTSTSVPVSNGKGKGPMPRRQPEPHFSPPPPPPATTREGAAAGTRGARKRQRTRTLDYDSELHRGLENGGGGVDGMGAAEGDDADQNDDGSDYLGDDDRIVSYAYLDPDGGDARRRSNGNIDGGGENSHDPAGGDRGDGDDGEYLAASAGAVLEDAAAQDEAEPLYVNAKQYHRILKRRIARARLEEMGRLSRERKVRALALSPPFARHGLTT